ncbi:ABCA1 [Symbiodinium sp. CCMP2456]|nr:ABCA1 [Symbiodinium sp. CCMP2456]
MKYAGGDEEPEAHKAIYAALALPVHLAGPQDEETLARAVAGDLPERLRVKAAVAWARILRRPGRDATRAETLEYEVATSKLRRSAWISEPFAALELSTAGSSDQGDFDAIGSWGIL